jgi:hypothetical protein
MRQARRNAWWLWWVGILGFFGAPAAPACGGTSTSDGTLPGADVGHRQGVNGEAGNASDTAQGSDAGGGAPTTGSGGTSGASPSGGSTGSAAPTGPACPGELVDEWDYVECDGVLQPPLVEPVDLFLMVDRSATMACDLSGGTCPAPAGSSRWDGLMEGMAQFTEWAETIGIRVGMGFFGGVAADGTDDLSCEPDQYSAPAVPMGEVPEAGAEIVEAMRNQGASLGGLSPTLPALRGAIDYASDEQSARSRTTVVVLITASLPTACPEPSSVDDVAAVAAAGLVSAGVRTYVLGTGPGLNDLDWIAVTGGSASATLFDSGSLADGLSSTLMSIATSPWNCSFNFGEHWDPTQAGRLFLVGPDARIEEVSDLYPLDECAGSSSGGVVDLLPSGPTIVLRLCECTCNRMKELQADLVLACLPRVFDDPI